MGVGAKRGGKAESGRRCWHKQLCPWGPSHSPDIRSLADRVLLNDLRGHKLRGPILAVLRLCLSDLLGKAKVADFNFFPSRMHHQDVGGLLGIVRK